MRDPEEADVEDEDDWDLADIPAESRTDVRASLRLDFNAISLRCRDASLSVPEKVNDVFGLALRRVDTIAEKKMLMEEKKVAIASRDSAVEETETERAKIVKLKGTVNSSPKMDKC